MPSADRITEFSHPNPSIQVMGETAVSNLNRLPFYRVYYDLTSDDIELAQELAEIEIERLRKVSHPLSPESLQSITTGNHAHLDRFFEVVTKGEALPDGATVVHMSPRNEHNY